MSRLPRIVIPDIPYHITHRGNQGQDTFLSNDHRTRYLKFLHQYSTHYRFDILAYCIMSNHIHLVGIPRETDSMSRMMQILQMRHTQAVNREMDRSGNLWHSRYFSTALDDPHLWAAIRYVEQNPIRAGMVKNAQDYFFSSASCHCDLHDDPLVYIDDDLSGMFDGWEEVLAQVPDWIMIERIRNRTMTGVPCGDEQFVAQISERIGRLLRMRKPGRPNRY